MESGNARRIKADTESVNAIQWAKLLIQARLGELLPAEKGGAACRSRIRIGM